MQTAFYNDTITIAYSRFPRALKLASSCTVADLVYRLLHVIRKTTNVVETLRHFRSFKLKERKCRKTLHLITHSHYES